jgi:PTS system cellobiose-specific IIC component
MPAGVPKFVVDAFSVLIPAVILAVVAALVKYLFSLTSIGSFHNLIYVILQTPFKKIGLSLGGAIFTETAATLAMFLGLHAGTVVGIVDPLRTAADLENLAAWQAGQPLRILLQVVTMLVLL